MDNNDTVKTTVGIADDANADTVSINDNGEVQPKDRTRTSRAHGVARKQSGLPETFG